jgi:hypothetical protein
MRLDRFTLRQVCRRTPAVVLYGPSRGPWIAVYFACVPVCVHVAWDGAGLYIYIRQNKLLPFYTFVCAVIFPRERKRGMILIERLWRERRVKIPVFGSK